jgi:DNA polymerase-1
MEEYESILADLGDDPRASLILEYRGWQKTVSASYEPFLKLASSDGRLRPNYKLHGTVTGRMSCEKPNLQQIPRISDKPWNGNLKQAFIATPGYTLFEADYSQLELRLATAYAGITSLTNAFAEDRDVFTEMSQSLGMSRHDTKTLTYTIQYGGGINRISNVFKVSAAEATLIRDNFFNRYPEFRRITKEANDSAKRNGYVKLWSGRRRHFTDPAKDSFKAFNSAIQGGSADIVARVINRLTSEVADDRCYFLLQVHDSVVFEVQQGYESEYLIKIQNIMEDVELICPVATGVKFAVAINEWGKK